MHTKTDAVADRERDGGGGDLRQFVAFGAGDESYAVPLAPVQEIIRVPAVTPVPLAPPALAGVANLRGRVLPLVSFRALCGLPPREADDATRALVIDAGHPVGLVVDRVSSVLGVTPDHIETLGEARTLIDGELVSGVIRDAGGHDLLTVLDVLALVSREFSGTPVGATAAGTTVGTRAAVADDEEPDAGAPEAAAADEAMLVSFEVDAQSYAIALEHVREIVQHPDRVVRVPNAASHVVGVMLLRREPLPLVCLRRLLGLPDRARDQASRIVVVGRGDQRIGLVTDRVDEVLRVPVATLDAVPDVARQGHALAEVTALCRLDEGRRLVSLLDVNRLFTSVALQEALDTVTDRGASPDPAAAGEAGAAEEQFVVLRLGTQEFGVPIASVQEIVRVPEQLTPVPQAPAVVEGVMNLRGTVLPVVDLRRRLGLPPVERAESHRVLVMVIDGVRTGFVVDAVAEVLKVPARAIVPAPRLSASQAALLGRVVNLEASGRLVQLIAPRDLLEAGHLADVAALAA